MTEPPRLGKRERRVYQSACTLERRRPGGGSTAWQVLDHTGHALPRKYGGTDDSANLQALYWKCNSDKGAGDDGDIRRSRQRGPKI